MSKIILFLFMLLFVSFGGSFMVYGLYQINQASQTTDWPAVRGEVLEAKVRTHRSDNKETWACNVRYAYQVDGRSYEGDRVAYGYGGTNNEQMHKNLQRKLSKSKYVRVHYDPNHPSESTLAVGIHRSAYLPVIFGAAWVVFCGAIVFMVVLGDVQKNLPQRLAKLNDQSPSLIH